MNPKAGAPDSEFEGHRGQASAAIESKMSANPYTAPAEPKVDHQPRLTIAEQMFIGFLTLIAASISFAVTCGGIGWIGFMMAFPHGNGFGEFLMFSCWIVGAIVALAVGRSVARALRNMS